MKKLISLLAALSVGFAANAQSPVQVEFFSPEPQMIALLDYQRLMSFEIRLTGDFSTKTKATLTRHECRDGVFSSEMLNVPVPIADTIIFNAIAPAQSAAEKVETGIMVYGGRMVHSSFSPPGPYCILMETIPGAPLSTDDEISLIAYTAGIEKKITFNGVEGTLIDYCGLRDAHIPPAEWHEKHDIASYTWYTVKFE